MYDFEAAYFVDMQTSSALYFCYHKIDIFFATLKTRYDMNSRRDSDISSATAHIEPLGISRILQEFISMRCYATQLRGIRFRCNLSKASP